MFVNKVTGERYQKNLLGANIILVSMSTGIQRILTPSPETRRLFKKVKAPGKQLPIKVRPEAEIIPDLVRSLLLEVNYLERRGQKIFLKIR